MDEELFSPFRQALGRQTWERMNRQIRDYEYYNGKQHVDPRTGQLVKAADLERPDGLDYDPTRYATNYFKSFIKRKARWQMGGKHGLSVPVKQIDPTTETSKPDYVPSDRQAVENERSERYERLLYQLWRENRMNEALIKAARDRLIAGRVGCKIVFNPETGRIKWVWRPDTEIIPVYSDDDFEELIAVHFIAFRQIDNENMVWKQSFTLEGGVCYLEEGIYDQELKLVEQITQKASMELDFIPVVLFPISELSGEDANNSEIEDMKEQTDVLNAMNEDAIDSLKFEMFSMTALLNVPEGTANKVRIAPGAVIEASGNMDKAEPNIKKIEGGFRWKEAFADQYARVKGALHEITNIPNVVPQELNFGGLNGDALHVLFQSIIQETEEHWLSWGPRLEELHEKTIRYLQARMNNPKFAYDKDTLRMIGDDYTNEIKFVLPLPDNRKELVELLTLEMGAELESQAGAMNRLGVENVTAKKQEIANERQLLRRMGDPYGEEDDEI